MIKRAILITALAAWIVGSYGYCNNRLFSPRLNLAYVEFHDALLGGDLFAGVSLDINKNLAFDPTVYTYQITDEWSTYGGVGLFRVRFAEKFPAKVLLWGGGTYDRVDLRSISGQTSSNLTRGTYTRFVPTYGVGVQVDSVAFICKGCNYFFHGKLMAGDFATPMEIQFGGLSGSSAPETLSTLVVGEVLIDSPFGQVGVMRHLRTRGWYGDNFWRAFYATPYCCGGLFRCRAGWESGYLGFADFEVKIKQFSIIAGVKIPEEPSLWMWSTGIVYHPAFGKSQHANPGDIRILAPRTRSLYE